MSNTIKLENLENPWDVNYETFPENLEKILIPILEELFSG